MSAFGWIEWTRLIAKCSNKHLQKRSVSTERWFERRRSMRGNTHKDTREKKKHSDECFWLD